MIKILLLGHTGKMGIALNQAFQKDYLVVGKNSKDFEATDFKQVERMVKEVKPEIVINTVAMLGIDPCERDPQRAFLLNTLYPKFLAELSSKEKFLLVHFSTDAVFKDRKDGYYTERDRPFPLNIYGFTKCGGDCFVQNIAQRYYIFRISLLFGPSKKNTQFVEKMLLKVKAGAMALRVANDIVCSPTYSYDVANKIKEIIEKEYPYGLYHLANKPKASLYELMKQIVSCLQLKIKVQKASYKDFKHSGKKNTYTPLSSIKVEPLRPWKEAVKEYCQKLTDLKEEQNGRR